MSDEYDAMSREELLIRAKDWRQVANNSNAEIRRLTAKNERLRTVIRRALRELPVPSSYGPDTVWNDMLDVDAEGQP